MKKEKIKNAIIDISSNDVGFERILQMGLDDAMSHIRNGGFVVNAKIVCNINFVSDFIKLVEKYGVKKGDIIIK